MWGQHVYKDSRNTQSVAQGDAFVDFVIARLAQSRCQCEKITDVARQIRCGDAILNGKYAEIKLDNVCTRSMRLAIEIAEKTRRDAPWVPSGIYAPSEAFWYIQGNHRVFFVFRRSDLRRLFEETYPRVKDTNPDTIKSFYLPWTGKMLVPYTIYAPVTDQASVQKLPL